MFTFSNHESFVYIYNGHKTVGIYHKNHRELEIMGNHPEHGVYTAMRIPTLYIQPKIGRPGKLLVNVSYPELGFEKAVEIPPQTACSGCIYQTGEKFLPCAVNPIAFGEGCREYSN